MNKFSILSEYLITSKVKTRRKKNTYLIINNQIIYLNIYVYSNFEVTYNILFIIQVWIRTCRFRRITGVDYKTNVQKSKIVNQDILISCLPQKYVVKFRVVFINLLSRKSVFYAHYITKIYFCFDKQSS